jgi:hypothetical protein
MFTVLANIDDWLALDAWPGGAEVDQSLTTHRTNESFLAFRAVSMVISMTTELTETAVTMADRGRFYAVGTVIRPLTQLVTQGARHGE